VDKKLITPQKVFEHFFGFFHSKTTKNQITKITIMGTRDQSNLKRKIDK